MKKTLTTVLLFAGMTSAWASGLPEGSYKASCKDIKMVGASLQATCKTGASTMGYDNVGQYRSFLVWSDTSLEKASTCAAVENLNGKLSCLRQK